jgi:cystathionine gamma-synthase
LCTDAGREVRYRDAGAEVPPPAMLIYDTLVVPSDGVILSPEDIAASVRDRLPEAEVADLCRLLEATQEPWMEEWSGD